MTCIIASDFRPVFRLMFRVARKKVILCWLLNWNNIKVEMEQCTGSSLISPLHHQLSALSSYGILHVASFTHLEISFRRWTNSR